MAPGALLSRIDPFISQVPQDLFLSIHLQAFSQSSELACLDPFTQGSRSS
jgi:hypothetical protein